MSYYEKHEAPRELARMRRVGWMAGRLVRRDGWNKGKEQYIKIALHIFGDDEFISP